jgi:hypothetical protein
MFVMASLVITSETLESAFITQHLDLEPTSAHEKGTRMSKRDPKSELYLKTVWSLQSDLPDDRPVADHISMLLSEIEPRISRLTSLTETCDLFLFCSLSHDSEQESSRLDHLLWQRLARLPAPVVLDLNPPSIEDEEKLPDGPSRTWTTGFFEIRNETKGPDEITNLLGLEPTKVREPALEAERTTTTWQLDSGLPTSALLQDHVSTLLDKVEGHTDILSTLAPSSEPCLSLSFASEIGQGGGWFNHELVERIARVSVDMLLYLVPPSLDDHDPAVGTIT